MWLEVEGVRLGRRPAGSGRITWPRTEQVAPAKPLLHVMQLAALSQTAQLGMVAAQSLQARVATSPYCPAPTSQASTHVPCAAKLIQ